MRDPSQIVADETSPAVSVAITVRDSEATVGSVIAALMLQQIDAPFEVVVSVGKSSDKTLEVLHSLADEYEWLRVVEAPRPGIPAGRNSAIIASSGEYVLTCDADDEVGPNWVQDMLADLSAYDAVAGRVVVRSGQDGPGEMSGVGSLGVYPYGYLPYGLTANLGFRRSAFDLVGGFDEHIRYADDVDFTWRIQQAGLRLGLSRGLIVKQGRATPVQRFRQHLAFGQTDAVLYRKHRAQGMPRRLWMSIKAWLWLLVTVWKLPLARHRYTWCGVAGHRLGRIIGSARARVFYP